MWAPSTRLLRSGGNAPTKARAVNALPHQSLALLEWLGLPLLPPPDPAPATTPAPATATACSPSVAPPADAVPVTGSQALDVFHRSLMLDPVNWVDDVDSTMSGFPLHPEAGTSAPPTLPAGTDAPASAPAPSPVPSPRLFAPVTSAFLEPYGDEDEPLPLLSPSTSHIVPFTSLPSEDEVMAYYQALPHPHSSDDHFLGLIEIGWGGAFTERTACVGPCVQYALAQGWLMTHAQVCAYYHPVGTPDHDTQLAGVDRGFGGNGDGRAITPLAEFHCRVDPRLMILSLTPFAEGRGPVLIDLAECRLANRRLFPLMVEELDLTLGGDGLGLSLIDDLAEEWDPVLCEAIHTVARGPLTRPKQAVAVCAHNILSTIVGNDACPPLFVVGRFLRNATVHTGVPLATWSDATISLVMSSQAALLSRSAVPWWRDFPPHAISHVAHLADRSPTPGAGNSAHQPIVIA